MFDINVKKCSCFVLSLIKLTSRDFALFRASSLLFGISGLSGLNGKGASQFPWLFLWRRAKLESHLGIVRPEVTFLGAKQLK